MASPRTGQESRMQLTKDQIINHLGGFGRYQKFMTFIFCLINFIFSYEILIIYFSTLTPMWRCRENSTLCLWNETYSGDDYRRCNIPEDEWEYTKPDEFSLVTTFRIHCREHWLLHLASSAFFIGWAVSSVMIGWISDNFGRKIVIIPSLTIMLLVEFISPFSPNIYIFIACRFVIGCFAQGTTPQGCILLSEITNNRWRPISTTLIHITSSIAWCILGLKAYHLQNWKHLSFVCTAPYIFLIAFYKVIPESIEWLVEHDEPEGVMGIFRLISRWNKKTLDPNVTMIAPENISYKNTNPLMLFRTRQMTYRCLTHCLIWCFGSMGYFGLSFAANNLGGSVYRDFILLQVAELPAVPCAIIASTYRGRKATVLVSYFIGGIVLLTIGGLPTSFQFARIALGMVGKYLLGIGYNSIILWSTETFPTRYRSVAFSYLSISARCGTIAAPWIVQSLYHFGNWIPTIIMGVTLLVTSLCSIGLPETKELRMHFLQEYTDGGNNMFQGTNVEGISSIQDQNDQNDQNNIQGKNEESNHIVQVHIGQGNNFEQGSNEEANDIVQGDSEGEDHIVHGYNDDGTLVDRRDNDEVNSFIEGFNDEGQDIREENIQGKDCNDEVTNVVRGGNEKRNDLVQRHNEEKDNVIQSHKKENEEKDNVIQSHKEEKNVS